MKNFFTRKKVIAFVVILVAAAIIFSFINKGTKGIVGTITGIGLVMIGGSFISIPIVVNPASIVLAVAFAMIIGIFFGYYPAKKAANSDPIDALRYE